MKHIVSTNQRKTFHYFLIVILFFCIQSCKSPNGPTTADVALTVSDASCTEAWLNLTVNNLTSNTKVQLVRNSIVVNTFDITTRDTTLYDDSLSPNKTYNYQVVELQNGRTAAKSEMVAAKTMDTTSNNFTWRTFTFGGNAGSCTLNDVAIVNDTLAYAVGAVYLNDTTGKPDPNAYNLAKWNGHSWQLLRIQFYTVRGNSNRTSYPTSSIFVFSDSVIWISMDGDQLAEWNGNTQSSTMFLPNSFSIKKILGENSNLLYAVGDNGNIDYYTNGSWQKIESGTTTDINDIWGYIDPNTSQPVELCAISFVSDIGDYKILKINGNKVDSLKWNTGRRVQTIWTKNGSPIYVGGGGVFENKRGYWKEITDIPLDYSRSIRGTGLNDIYVCGDYGLFAHFNGVRWKVYNSLAINGIYFALAVKGDLFVAVGTDNNSAIIVMGRRE